MDLTVLCYGAEMAIDAIFGLFMFDLATLWLQLASEKLQ